MGIDQFLIADALLGVLSQRLTKRLCLKCRRPRQASAEDIDGLLSEYAADMERSSAWKQDPRAGESALRNEWEKQFADPSGAFTIYDVGRCEECSGTGFDGRIALHELLVLNDEIKRAVQERARSNDIFELALAAGMRTLRQDGILKVLGGDTDLKQVHAACVR
jgi:type II secretory ATPase GspE/PulE/Tfp pilus assembly ATPase PilB-like protein